MTLYFVLPVRAGKQGLSQYFFLTLEFNMPQVNITDFACRKAMSFYHFARLRKKKKSVRCQSEILTSSAARRIFSFQYTGSFLIKKTNKNIKTPKQNKKLKILFLRNNFFHWKRSNKT